MSDMLINNHLATLYFFQNYRLNFVCRAFYDTEVNLMILLFRILELILRFTLSFRVSLKVFCVSSFILEF